MTEGPAECNIKVICRVRPLNDAEERAGSRFILKFLSDEAVSVGGKNFTYDRVYKPDSTQEEVYVTVAKPIVKDVLSGYNGTIFAYGQTASGKTHTMEGEIGNPTMSGIIPRIIGDIFGYIYQMNENIEFHIKVSYFEIYMDKIRDLLDITQTNLSVHEDKNRVPYVKGATERFVASPDEVLDVIEEGKANRHVAVTNMNEHSSRSHSVFLINVKQVNIETEKKLSGKLYLVDLAGSEKVSKTGAEGSVLDEAKNINKSLSALGNVIAALADNAGFVPYRDSKLTRILQESLGGNARTTMIICCSPASFNDTETKSTLLFGSRAKTIKNSVMINEELTAEEWKRRYEKERDKNLKLKFALERCQAELVRWRSGESVPDDERMVVVDDTSSSSVVAKTGNTSLLALESERSRLEDEKIKLYQQLDDKDEELSSQLEFVEKLKEQISEAEDQIRSLVRERDGLTNEVSRLQNEKESSNNEIKEVFQALSELAQNYDQKLSESLKRKEENDALTEELEKHKENIKMLELDIEQARETVTSFKKKVVEMNALTSKDIVDIAAFLGPDIKVELYKSFEKLEDDGSMLRLMFNKLKSEVKVVVQKCCQLEAKLLEANKRFEDSEKDLIGSRLIVQQLEAKIKSLNESLREIEGKKRFLETQVDDLNEICSQLKTKEKMYMVQLQDLEKKEHEVASTTQMKEALEAQMESHHKQHQLQISELRNNVSEKEKLIGMLNQQADELRITLSTLQHEHELLKKEESRKTSELKDLNWNLERREQAAKDLKGLEEAVAKDLQLLRNLRKLFIADLEDKVKKIQVNQEDDEITFNTTIQKQKISFLESNLDQLTKVHKQLVRDNADLRCELPKLEKRLKATMERIRALETALKEAKEGALKDRKRYQQEIDRIKEAVRQKSLLRRGHSATIVKPIRAGHAPPSYIPPIRSNAESDIDKQNTNA